MNVIGIIAEYNPFHNGHAYQIAHVRKNLHADYIVVAASGDYVQRGEPALLDKYTRARMALFGCGSRARASRTLVYRFRGAFRRCRNLPL